MEQKQIINTENGVKFFEAFNKYCEEVELFLKVNYMVRPSQFKPRYERQHSLLTPADARHWRELFYGKTGDIATVKQLLKEGQAVRLTELATCLHNACIAFKDVEKDIINQNTNALNLLEEL